MDTSHSPEYKTALSAALKAGEVLQSMRQSGFEVSKKGARDLLTSADLAAEKIVIEEIRSRFPGHYIMSEEASPEMTAQILEQEHVWIIDPIDGTTNFSHGHQVVSTSIAYASKGKVFAGVVHAPFLNETFAAERGTGATLNGKPIRCGEAESLTDCLVATGFPYVRDNTDLLTKRLSSVLNNCRDVRRLGSAAIDICWVACGRFDAYYETCMVWDIAAGSLIAREAGAEVGHLGAVPANWKAASELYPVELVVINKRLFREFCSIL